MQVPKYDEMKKPLLGILSILLTGFLQGQNSLSLSAGYLFTHTSIAEYRRPDFNFYILDYVSLDPDISSVYASIGVNIDLGNRFYLSTGVDYQEKGISNISFTDTLNTFYSYKANKHYIGWSLILNYHYRFHDSRFGIFAGAGPKIDFAVGYFNVAEAAPFRARDFMTPFARFNVVDFSIAVEAGTTYRLGPGHLFLRLDYFQGLSDVLKDDYVIGKTISFGLDAGYCLPLEEIRFQGRTVRK